MQDRKLKLISGEGEAVSGRSKFVEKYEPIRCGKYSALISRDIRIDPPVFHFIILREGSNEILSWQQATSLEAAQSQARKAMEELTGSGAIKDSIVGGQV